jgi:hypothetical protein
MIKHLNSLITILEKANLHAQSKATDWFPAEKRMGDLLDSSLIFDQFPFVRQIQIATDNAKGGAARLAGIEVPVYEDNETSLEEVKARLQKTILFLESVKLEQIVGHEDISIVLPYHKDKYLTGFDYATQYLLPNFFFHLTTAYSILRKNGVDIGKSDFMGNVPFKDLPAE